MKTKIRLASTIQRGEFRLGKWIEYFIDIYGNKRIVYSGKYRERFGDLEDDSASQEWQLAGYLF